MTQLIRIGPVAVPRRSLPVSPNREVSRRHMAMAGLNVSPVHGWHCTCVRCARSQRGER